jgi:hypothetical protein
MSADQKSLGAAIIELNPEETLVSEIAEVSLRGSAAKLLPQII